MLYIHRPPTETWLDFLHEVEESYPDANVLHIATLYKAYGMNDALAALVYVQDREDAILRFAIHCTAVCIEQYIEDATVWDSVTVGRFVPSANPCKEYTKRVKYLQQAIDNIDDKETIKNNIQQWYATVQHTMFAITSNLRSLPTIDTETPSWEVCIIRETTALLLSAQAWLQSILQALRLLLPIVGNAEKTKAEVKRIVKNAYMKVNAVRKANIVDNFEQLLDETGVYSNKGEYHANATY